MAVITKTHDMEDFASTHELHLALGYFDGLHLGHQALLERTLSLAGERGGEPGVLLLDPHPQKVLGGNGGFRNLNTLDEKIRMIRAFGDIHIFILSFDLDLARLSPEAFVRDYLVGLLRIKSAVCGYNYRFGHKGQGNSGSLERMGETYRFGCCVLPQVTDRGNPVSSTEIRRLIESGAMYEAYSRLGHVHVFTGNVIDGQKLGSRLGFPTANLALDAELLWPAYGVYGGFVRIDDGAVYQGIINAGIRPTVNQAGGAPSFEIFLTDFHEDLYGRKLQAVLTDRLRPEKAFDSVGTLKAQISRDVTGAGSALSEWEKRLRNAGESPESIFACVFKRDSI